MKKILFVDMDNVLVDFPSGIAKLSKNDKRAYEGKYDETPGIFLLMDPIKGAVESFTELAGLFDIYILSTSPWENPSAWSDKLIWVKKYLGKPAYKRLILTHHKNLNHGDYLIDDRTARGVDRFKGKHIHFGVDPKFPDWRAVVHYLRKEACPGRHPAGRD